MGHLGRGAPSDDLPAVAAGRRAEIQQLVGVLNYFAVVLDDQQRVSEVAELFEGVQEPAIVAGMQPDGRLVEHIEHAAQAAADLRRQTDALHFAARKRGGRPRERQVVQAHVHQKLHPVANLAGHFARHFTLRVRRLPIAELLQQPAQRQAAKLVDRPAAQPHGRRIVAEPAATADGTLHFVDEMFKLRAEGRRGPARFLQGRIQTFVLEAEREIAGVRAAFRWDGS